MKKIYLTLLICFAILVSCEEGNMPKPDHLIKEKQMINMLVDIHIAEAMHNHFRRDTTMRFATSANCYYSVLDKYSVIDTVFEQSLLYYESVPKNYEKMYQEIMNILSEKEQQYSGRKEKINVEENKSSKKK